VSVCVRVRCEGEEKERAGPIFICFFFPRKQGWWHTTFVERFPCVLHSFFIPGKRARRFF